MANAQKTAIVTAIIHFRMYPLRSAREPKSVRYAPLAGSASACRPYLSAPPVGPGGCTAQEENKKKSQEIQKDEVEFNQGPMIRNIKNRTLCNKEELNEMKQHERKPSDTTRNETKKKTCRPCLSAPPVGTARGKSTGNEMKRN